MHPLMVAVSGFIDFAIESKAKAAGFERVYESPLSEDQIRLEIMKELEERAESVKKAKEGLICLKQSSGRRHN